MPRTFRSWVGVLALAAAPGLVMAQAAAPSTHTVRKGDTLWDLAKLYRGDPFLWPDIYRLNTSVVEDPHWIYPGEVLRLSGGEDVASVPATDTPAPTAADTGVALADGGTPTGPAEPVAGDGNGPSASSPSSGVLNTDSGESEPGTLFGAPRGQTTRETLLAYTQQAYRALRRSEFYSSGFLTENEQLPFGKVLGPVTPQQIRATNANANATLYTTVALEAPRGATYQLGDTLLVLTIGREFRPWGDQVQPTGLAQITDTVEGRYLAQIVAVYGAIRSGQLALPAEKFTPSGTQHAVPVSDGVRATLLGGPGRQELKAPQMVVFLDNGRDHGVAPGDLFEIRREPRKLADGTMVVDEVMATLQLVHAGSHTSTARILNVVSPDIPPGTQARQVAKLP
jgi:LysM repeat protein